MAKKRQTISLQGTKVSVIKNGEGDYISLTDIAKLGNKESEPRFLIQNWMKNTNTIRYLYHWEQLHNPKINRVHLQTVLENATNNRLTMSPTKWIELVEAIGLVSKTGRNGGTYAHSDIAINFCYWLDPIFQIYLIKEYQRLKSEEAKRQGLSWDLRRELSKINYRLHQETVKRFLIPKDWGDKYKTTGIYANEADMFNIAVFGMTASEWRDNNPRAKGNIRDHASELELLVLSNLEAINSELIKDKVSAEERLMRLRVVAQYQLIILKDDVGLKRLKPPGEVE